MLFVCLLIFFPSVCADPVRGVRAQPAWVAIAFAGVGCGVFW
jgi:hypothetical protein